MLKKLKSFNFILLFGVLLLLLPLLSYIVAHYAIVRNTDAYNDISKFVALFSQTVPFDLRSPSFSLLSQTPEYRNEIYFSVSYYLVAIILSVVLLVRNFSKEITRVICIMAAVVALLHFISLSCDAVLLLLRNWPTFPTKMFMRYNALIIAIPGYLVLFAGLVVSWVKTKDKRPKAEVVQ